LGSARDEMTAGGGKRQAVAGGEKGGMSVAAGGQYLALSTDALVGVTRNSPAYCCIFCALSTSHRAHYAGPARIPPLGVWRRWLSLRWTVAVI